MASRKHPTDEIALSEGDTPTALVEDQPGYFFSKTKIIATVVLLVVLVIIVIVLAALLGAVPSKNRKEKLEEPTGFHSQAPTIIPPTTAGSEAWWNSRLPKSVIPNHYNLFLNITVDLPSYDGRVDIEVEVNNATDLVILHSIKINMTSVEIRGRGLQTSAVKVRNHFSFPKYSYYVIQTEEHLRPGRYLIKLVFAALFSTGVTGMYRASFKRASDDKEVNYAATQFEDLHARRAFPCFDEPAMKATFNVTIAHRPDYVALCNMPIYKTATINNERLDHYSKSVVMPTYLLAFVVGDFKVKQAVSKNNITMGYFSRPSYANKLDYALSVGGKIMTYYEDLFDIKYSLPKEDMVAVPKFAAGAMENWGLVLYRETYLLWDAKESTEKSKIGVASVIAHELVHMWFGNIVTLNWWNDIWLNEGFAQYFQAHGRSVAEPDWKKVDQGICGSLWDSMMFDSSSHSNPVSEKANSVTSTIDMSSLIFYSKGSCVIRMIEGFLGEKTFLQGLRIYLKRHAFGNTVTDDLWKALEEAACTSGKCMDMKQVMDTWTLQMGFPVVTFTKKNATHYMATQRHFKTSKNATYRKSDFGYSWVIPLTYTIKGQGTSFTWMNRSSAAIKWDGKGWIKGNTGHTGYFITNYDDRNWKALADQLNTNHTVFSPSDRAGLILDLAQLVNDIRQPKIEYSTILTLIEYMRNETDYLPWTMALRLVDALLRMLPRTSRAHRYLVKYVVFLGTNQYNRLGFQDTGSSPDKFLRETFLELFCKANFESCTKKAKELFKAWMNNPIQPPAPNLYRVVLYNGVAHGGLEEWEFLYNQYNKTNNQEVRVNIITGLAASREPWIIARYLWYLFDSSRFNVKDRIRGLYAIISTNPLGVQTTWGFIRANWERLANESINSQFNEEIGKKVLFYIIPVLTSHFDNHFMLEELKRFVEQKFHNLPSKGMEEHIKKRIAWIERNGKIIEETLEKLLVKHNVL